MEMEHLNPAQTTTPSPALTTRSSVGPPYVYIRLHSDMRPTVWRRAAGTPRQIVDLVPANSNLNPTYEKRVEWEEFERRGWWGSWFGWWNPSHGGTYAKVPVVGTLLQEEWAHRHGLKGLAGNDYEFLDWESPLFANGTTVPRGELLPYGLYTLIGPNPPSRVVPIPPPCAEDYRRPDERRGLRDISLAGSRCLPLCVIPWVVPWTIGSQLLHYKNDSTP